MLRVWIVSGLIVAAAVAAVLHFTKEEPAPEPERTAPPAVSRLLTERHVRLYIELWPGMNEIYQRAVTEFQRRRTENVDSSLNVKGSVSDYLRKSNLTLDDWNRIRERVEYVVSALRARAAKPERDEEIEASIRRLESAREGANEALRKKLDEQIATERARLAYEGPPVHPQDEALVKGFWKDLDRIVPRSVAEAGSK